MTLTKQDLIESIQDSLQFSRKESMDVVENVLEIIKDNLASGNDVLISGFGKFCVKDKAARRGRNPANGEPMTLPARKVITFKCSGKLKDRVNGNEDK